MNCEFEIRIQFIYYKVYLLCISLHSTPIQWILNSVMQGPLALAAFLVWVSRSTPLDLIAIGSRFKFSSSGLKPIVCLAKVQIIWLYQSY